MDFQQLLQAVLMGLVEGLTEFLPVSSTGHLILAASFMHLEGESVKAFEVFIQLGAILAVCWFYRARLSAVVRSLTQDGTSQRFVINLAIGVIPFSVLGLALHKLIKTYLFQPLTVALALVVGGLAILVIERIANRPRIVHTDDVHWPDALKLGLAQTAALFPGISRSGATIMGGLLFGLSRQVATEYSFFLAIPVMFMATGYEMLKVWPEMHWNDAGFFAVGFVVAFISALVTVKALLRYVGNHNFRVFAIYRIVMGLLVGWYFWQ